MTGLKVLWSALLLLNTWRDLRRREIFAGITLTAGIFAWAARAFTENSAVSAAADLLPGGFLLCMGLLSRGKIGGGDGLMVCVGGLCLGLEEILAVVSLGFLFGVPAGLVVRRHGGKDGAIPFLPCLLAAYCVERIWWH